MQLKQRISDLLCRVRQLAQLLRAAKIPIPTELHAVDFDEPMKWSGRLRKDAHKELSENLQKKSEYKIYLFEVCINFH